jgi:hypothetical protein
VQFDPRVIDAFSSIPRTRIAEIGRYYDARAANVLGDGSRGAQAGTEVVTCKPAVEVDC